MTSFLDHASVERFKAAEAVDRANGTDDYSPQPQLQEARVVTLEDFAAVEEAGAEAIMGEPDRILIPQGGDVMLYGAGGAGKTVLSVDLDFHLAAGDDWLGIPVSRPRKVLIIESEGPRPLFRRKLARKLATWGGSPIGGRVMVFEAPWGEVTFTDDGWRMTLAQLIAKHEIDVVCAGPVTRLGMDSAGTLQEVRAFMDLINDVRTRSGRPLTLILIHHENKGGAVSGAWEGAGDTLLHIQAAGNGHTVAYIQKARWDSSRHGTTLKLMWRPGEAFALEGDRDHGAEIEGLLSDGCWRTAKEIAQPVDEGGIGAGEKEVKQALNAQAERFESRTGEAAKELGRHPSATVWQVRSDPNSPNAPSEFLGGVGEGELGCVPLKGRTPSEHTPTRSPVGESSPTTHPPHLVAVEADVNGRRDRDLDADADAELERIRSKFGDPEQP